MISRTESFEEFSCAFGLETSAELVELIELLVDFFEISFYMKMSGQPTLDIFQQ